MTPNIRLAALVALIGVMLAQTIGKTPTTGNSTVHTALDEAGQALKQYQLTLESVRDLPQLDTTVRRDLQAVLSDRITVMWLASKASLEGTVDTSEFEGLLQSLDVCAANAALSSSVLAAGAARTGHTGELHAAMDLASNSEQLRYAIKHLRQALKPYLQPEKPPRIA